MSWHTMLYTYSFVLVLAWFACCWPYVVLSFKIFRNPFSWKTSSLFLLASVSCSDSRPYTSFDLIIALYATSFSLVEQAACPQNKSSLFNAIVHSAICFLVSLAASALLLSLHPRNLTFSQGIRRVPSLKHTQPVFPKWMNSISSIVEIHVVLVPFLFEHF